MTKEQKAFAWPPRCAIRLYEYDNGSMVYPPLATSSYRLFDISDEIEPPLSIYFELSTKSAKWHKWDKFNLARIEVRIRYDLEFENYDVVIERLGAINSAYSQEFLWRLDISENEPG